MGLLFVLANEISLWHDEQEETEFLGLYDINLPFKIEGINHQSALRVFQIITAPPKPALIHCHNSTRSAAMVLLYIATEQGIAFESALQRTIKLGLLG